MKAQTTQHPELRFSEFADPWELKPFKQLLVLTERPFKMADDGIYSLIKVRRGNNGVVSRGLFKGRKVLVKAQFKVETDDFVISKRQIVHQACGIVPKDLDGSIVSNEYNVFKPSAECCIRYFNYLTYRPEMRHAFFLSCVGVHLEKMLFKTNDWLKRKFYFPSVEEQQKIADFLTAVDGRIGQLIQKKALLEDYKKGVMQQLFTQTIRFKDDHGNDFPAWKEKKLGSLGTTYSGLSGKSGEDFGTGKPYVTYSQIFDRTTIDLDKCKLVRIEQNEKQNRIKKGDILFTTSSETRLEVGFTSVVLDDPGEIYLNSFCFGFRLSEKVFLLTEYARYLFHSADVRRAISVLGQGSTRYNISKKELMKLALTLPSPEEQSKIADFLSTIDRKIESVATQISETQTFKRGLLQQMFV